MINTQENNETLETLIQQKKKIEENAALTIEDREDLEVIKSLFPEAHIFANRSENFLYIEGIFDQFLQLKTDGRICYALLPGNESQYKDLEMRLVQSDLTEPGYVRAMFNAPVDLIHLKSYLANKIKADEEKSKK